MAIKRKIRETDIQEEEKNKSAKMEADRLSNLPEGLQVRILSFLDAKEALKTSVLSKTWVSLWTWNPVLEFHGFTTDNLYSFDKSVNKVLRLRNPLAKLDRLIFTRRGTSSAKILKNAFDYAFSHDVKQFEAFIVDSRSHTWPFCLNASFESLTSLKLESQIRIGCPFLGPRSGSFKNLTDLYLKGALITDPEPFSGFPVLEKLTLLNCDIVEGKTLNIHARNLSDLTISDYRRSFNCCELTTPRLRLFRYRGYDFPLIRTHEGVPVLDTMAIDFNGACDHMHKKKTFDDLLSMFCALPDTTSLTLFSSTVEILSSFREELVRRKSPFPKLKFLKLDFRFLQYQNIFDRPLRWPFKSSIQIPSDVKAYLLENYPNTKVTPIYPEYWDAEDILVSPDLF